MSFDPRRGVSERHRFSPAIRVRWSSSASIPLTTGAHLPCRLSETGPLWRTISVRTIVTRNSPVGGFRRKIVVVDKQFFDSVPSESSQSCTKALSGFGVVHVENSTAYYPVGLAPVSGKMKVTDGVALREDTEDRRLESPSSFYWVVSHSCQKMFTQMDTSILSYLLVS